MQLTDAELQEAAQCARIGQHQALADAAKQSNPGIRATFEEQARQREALARKFEAARTRR